MSDNKPQHTLLSKVRNFLSEKKLVVVVIISICLIAVGAVSYFVIIQSNKSSQSNNSNGNKNNSVSEQIVSDTSSDAKILVDKGETGQAIKLYDNTIASTQDSGTKNALIVDKSLIYYNAKDYKNAADTLDEIVNPEKTSSYEEYVADVYEQAGDKVNAIAHYQKAIEYVDSNDPMSSGNVEYYQSRIKALEG